MTTGEELKELYGKADVEAIAGQRTTSLFALSNKFETLVQHENGEIVAFFPDSFQNIKTHPGKKSWVSGIESYLCIISLQGGSEL